MNTLNMNGSQQCLACAVALGARPGGAVAGRRADVRVWLAVAALGVIASVVLAWQAAPEAKMTPARTSDTAVTAEAAQPLPRLTPPDCPVPTLEGMSCPVPDLPSP
jgi:hypothetical protein